MLATVKLSEYGCDLNNKNWDLVTSLCRNKSGMSTEIDGVVSKPSNYLKCHHVTLSNMSSPSNDPCYVHPPPLHCTPTF